MKRLLLVLACCLWAVNAQATVYYVSGASGSNSNSCGTATSTTQSNQKATIGGASGGLSCLTAGDTLTVHGATYVENVSVPSSSNGSNWTSGAVTVQGYPAETVWVIPASGNTAVVFPTGGTALQYQIWIGINLDCINLTGGVDPCLYIGHDAHHIRWRDSEIKRAYWSGVSHFGGPYIELIHNHIHDGGRCAGSCDGAHGIYGTGFSGGTTGADQHILYEANTIDGFNQLSFNAGLQIYTGGADRDQNGGTIMRKNILTNNTIGISITNVTTVPVVMYDNLIYDNTGSGVWFYCDLAGVLFYNNVVHSNGDIGIQNGPGCLVTGSLIKNNAITSNTGAPITNWNTDASSIFTAQFNDYNGNGNGNAVNDQNSNGTNNSNITTAPGFTNAGAGDFTISAGGNLVNAGTTLATVADDIAGVSRPQGAAYDIGAYELVSTSGTPRRTLTLLGIGQ